MKKIILPLSILITSSAWAQFTVAPFGASSVSAPPVGESRKSPCASGACAIEVIVRPFCFGTNLRVWDESKQLRPDGQVKMNLQLSNPSEPTKNDVIEVTFPAGLTYASDGVRMDCPFKPGQDMNQPGYKDIECALPWMNNEKYSYKLDGWKSSRNATANTDNDWVRYAARSMDALLIGSASVDKNITCLYKFTTADQHTAQLNTTAVSCYFPSQLPDMSGQVAIKKDGTAISPTMVATTNMIKFQLNEELKSMPTNVVVKHGVAQGGGTPNINISYTQGSSQLGSVREKETFDEANANKSLSVVVKFPGSEGFCGGFYSPLMMFFDDKIPHFSGVSLFPLYGAKKDGRVNWPEANSPGYFLALPSADGKISSAAQLFGQNSEYENGFEALKIHDRNSDGLINNSDPVWKSLRLWNDKNGDGISEASELVTLEKMKVKSIELKYSTKDPTNFQGRARAREKAKFSYVKNGKVVKSDIYDVWLAPID